MFDFRSADQLCIGQCSISILFYLWKSILVGWKGTIGKKWYFLIPYLVMNVAVSPVRWGCFLLHVTCVMAPGPEHDCLCDMCNDCMTCMFALDHYDGCVTCKTILSAVRCDLYGAMWPENMLKWHILAILQYSLFGIGRLRVGQCFILVTMWSAENLFSNVTWM